MTQDVYIIPIEKLDTRYSGQWYDHIPQLIEKEAAKQGKDVNVIIVDGEQVPPIPTPGAFLDFAATNIYKSSQLMCICDQFRSGKIKSGSKFLYTDAWNPTVIQLKYMSELLGIPIEIHGLHHAGSWDSQDFLGRLIGDKPWIRTAEKSMINCFDTNWFATTFHLDMFIKELFGASGKTVYDYAQDRGELIGTKKVDITGWPMEYLFETLKPYTALQKKKQIVFPHRLAPEKQLDIFKDLAASLPEYEWIVCQEKQLTKHEYHTMLGESQIVFSANLQETFGISVIEGLICGAIPMVPDRLSYTEMYDTLFKYRSEWTESWDSYLLNKDKLIDRIKAIFEYSETPWMKTQMDIQIGILDKYVRAIPLIEALLS
jgi:hypothetical protein